jgi:N4-gp56 family major capsid protein
MLQTTNNLKPAVAKVYGYKLIEARTRDLIYGIGLETRVLPRNHSKQIVYSMYDPLVPDKTPLGDMGATPKGQLLNKVDLTTKIQWYGTFIPMNEQVVLTNEDPTLNIAAEKLGVFAQETDDIIIRDVLASVASFQNCVYGTNGDTPTNITAADIAKTYTTLRSADGKRISSGKTGANKYGTSPIGDAYFALCHTDLINDLRMIPNYTEKIQYSNQEGILNSEDGYVHGTRFFVSSQGSIDTAKSSSGATVYNIITIAKDCAIRIKLEGNAQFLYNPPIDPLRQNFTCAVKWTQAARILNESYMVRSRATLLVS